MIMPAMKTLKRCSTLTALTLISLTSAELSPASADNCGNVAYEGVAQLGVIEIAPGVFGLGALPSPVTIAGVSGMMGSLITGMVETGGAVHYTMEHTFVSTDPARPGGFTTRDHAVAAPAGQDPNFAIINNLITVVDGTGVFANASGFLFDHGLLDLGTFTLTLSLRGRVCGNGL
jgi:hypothetical protein